MRSFFVKATFFAVVIGLLVLAGGYALAALAPFRPGDFVFPLQDFAEQRVSLLFPEAVGRASYFLDLLERRVEDLAARSSTEHEILALEYLDQALDQAAWAIAALSEEDAAPLRLRWFALAQRAQQTLGTLTVAPAKAEVAFTAFQSKLRALMIMARSDQITQQDLSLAVETLSGSIPTSVGNGTPVAQITPGPGLAVPFPPGSPGAQHTFYMLTGRHAVLECASCHSSGQYSGTPNTCEGCHLEQKPENHFPGACVSCHTPVSWQEVSFDHELAGAEDCLSCHSDDAPANHYPGQCSQCHTTSGWAGAVFDHTGFTDCLSCHSGDAPANHYPGQCSQCHTTGGWTGAVFDHTGFTDCLFCHSGDAPANHYPGQCSQCHTTAGWDDAAFDHKGFTDCISCHLPDRPEEHDSGQCSECHNTSSWDDADGDSVGIPCNDCHPSVLAWRKSLKKVGFAP